MNLAQRTLAERCRNQQVTENCHRSILKLFEGPLAGISTKWLANRRVAPKHRIQYGVNLVRLGSLVGLLALIISLYILWQIRQVLLLAFAAIVLATALNRLVRQFQKLHLKRGTAIAFSIGLFLLLLAGFSALIVPPFVNQVQELTELVPMGMEQLRNWSTSLQNQLPAPLWAEIQDLRNLSQQIQNWITQLLSNFFEFFYGSFNVLLNALLIFVVAIMLLANPEPYRRVFLLLFPAFYRQRIDGILDQCEQALGGWIIGILFNMFVIAVLSGIGLWILGVKLALANAVLAGLLTFIPNLGPTLSVVPPALLALTDAPWRAASVIVLYIAIQQLESNFLTPLVMARQVSLLPAFTLLSQVAFAIFFGFLGLFLALPIIVVLQVWLREVLIKDILDPWETKVES